MKALGLAVALLYVVVIAAAGAGYVAYKEHVEPQIERIRKIERLLEKLPKPFREDGGETCRCGCNLPLGKCHCYTDPDFGEVVTQGCPVEWPLKNGK